jgi:hypothetical protein
VGADGRLDVPVPKAAVVGLRAEAPGFRTAELDASADVEEFAVDLVPLPK